VPFYFKPGRVKKETWQIGLFQVPFYFEFEWMKSEDQPEKSILLNVSNFVRTEDFLTTSFQIQFERAT
jgi:hypothetical protein